LLRGGESLTVSCGVTAPRTAACARLKTHVAAIHLTDTALKVTKPLAKSSLGGVSLDAVGVAVATQLAASAVTASAVSTTTVAPAQMATAITTATRSRGTARHGSAACLNIYGHPQ